MGAIVAGGRADRWIEVTRSEYPWEQQGLTYLRGVVPNAEPYRVWTNFEFIDQQGRYYEVDALVLGRSRMHLVELKHYAGHISGDEHWWYRGRSTSRSPVLLAHRKAQRLVTRLKNEVAKSAAEAGIPVRAAVRAVPWIQEAVFLHHDSFTTDFTTLGRAHVFGFDGRTSHTGLHGITARITEAPTGQPIDEALGRLITDAMQRVAGVRRAERNAGSWLLRGSPVADTEEWQEWEAIHRVTRQPVRARVFTLPRGTPKAARDAAHRRAEREHTLLESLHHDSILAPRDIAQLDDLGETTLIYPQVSDYEPLDVVLAGRVCLSK